MARQVGTVTIASGQSLSDAYDCGSEYTLVGILVPSGWTTADITLAGAVHPGTTQPAPFGGPFPELRDSLTYSPVYLQTGATTATTTEFALAVGATGDKLLTIPDGVLEGIQFLKIRSGTSGTPVAQAADRLIKLVVSE